MIVPFLPFVLSLIMLLSGEVLAQTDSIFLERWHFFKQGIVGVYDIEGNFNPGRYTWTILTPAQSHIPELPNYVDPNEIQPFPDVATDSDRPNISSLEYRHCPDSDRCEFFLPQSEAVAAKRLLIRLAGIHAPHVNASCEQEAFLGKQAKHFLHEYLSLAVHIELRKFSKRGRELKGRLVADGQDLSELLVNQGLAENISGLKKDWCS